MALKTVWETTSKLRVKNDCILSIKSLYLRLFSFKFGHFDDNSHLNTSEEGLAKAEKIDFFHIKLLFLKKMGKNKWIEITLSVIIKNMIWE